MKYGDEHKGYGMAIRLVNDYGHSAWQPKLPDGRTQFSNNTWKYTYEEALEKTKRRAGSKVPVAPEYAYAPPWVRPALYFTERGAIRAANREIERLIIAEKSQFRREI